MPLSQNDVYHDPFRSSRSLSIWQEQRDWRNTRPRFVVTTLLLFSTVCIVSGAAGIWVGVLPVPIVAEGTMQDYVLPGRLGAYAGSTIASVGLVGMWTSNRIPKVLLTSMKWCLLSAVAIESWSGALGATSVVRVNAGLLNESLHRDMRDSYGVMPRITYSIDHMQKGLHCCGVKGPEDWKDGFWSSTTNASVPKSCCKEDTITCCNCWPLNTSLIFTSGCVDSETSLVKGYAVKVTGTSFGMALLHLHMYLAVGFLECRF